MAAGQAQDRAWPAALVLVVGVLIADPVLLVVVALPGALLIQRVGGESPISVRRTSWCSSPRRVAVSRPVEGGGLFEAVQGALWFQADLILVVVAHPYRDNVVEWFHRWSYVAGSVLVGWVIATHGRTRQAFRLYLAGSSVVAMMAMEHAVARHFQPAQWGVYQKNSIGAILWVAIVIAQINPSWAGIGRPEARVNKYLCVGGLLASQTRQSGILFILALALAAFLNPELRRRSKLILLAAVPMGVVLYYSFSLSARNNPGSTRCPPGSTRSRPPSTSGT